MCELFVALVNWGGTIMMGTTIREQAREDDEKVKGRIEY